jgi:hypothetical protein
MSDKKKASKRKHRACAVPLLGAAGGDCWIWTRWGWVWAR